MTLILTIEGASPASTQSLTEGQLSIGRDESCDWVLFNTNLKVSRLHCVIESRASGYWVTDKSKNGVFLNGSNVPVGYGQSERLNDGDQIRLADYRYIFRVQLTGNQPSAGTGTDHKGAAAADEDPFGVKERQQRLQEKASADRPNQQRAERLFDSNWPGRKNIRPLQEHDQPPSLLANASPARSVHTTPSQEYFQVRKPELDLPRHEVEHVEVGRDYPPLANPPSEPKELEDQQHPLDKTYIEDPEGISRRFGSASESSPTSSDEIRLQARPETSPSKQEEREASSEDGRWNSEAGPVKRKKKMEQPLPQPGEAGASQDPLQRVLASFLTGAGLSPDEVSVKDAEEFMKCAGEGLAALAEAFCKLLAARGEAKRVGGLEQTQVQSEGNNPFKMSANAQEAVRSALMSRGPGYLEPIAAIQAGEKDLYSHELGTMDGLRVAIFHLLGELDPEVIEKRVSPASFFYLLLKGGRGSAYWQEYKRYYSNITQRTHQDFLGDLNKEFKRAYDERVREIIRGPR